MGRVLAVPCVSAADVAVAVMDADAVGVGENGLRVDPCGRCPVGEGEGAVPAVAGNGECGQGLLVSFLRIGRVVSFLFLAWTFARLRCDAVLALVALPGGILFSRSCKNPIGGFA